MRKLTATALTTAVAIGLASAALAQSPASPGSAAPSAGGASSAIVSSASQAKAKLEASGYSNVQSVEKSGTGFTATAMKDGKSVRVAIDNHGNIETR